MKYNLTEGQKHLAKWFAQMITEGLFEDGVEIIWNDYEAKEALIYDEDYKPVEIPDDVKITGGALDIMEEEGFIVAKKSFSPAEKGSRPNSKGPFRYGSPRRESKRAITFRQRLFDAVENDFEMKDNSGATKDGRSVFINYRRSDSEAYAGRIYDKLADAFGEDRIYMDVDDIPLGTNFDEELESALEGCNAFIAVIGPSWLATIGEDGKRRLDHPDDFVRREIVYALTRDITVIPVLVGEASMPKSESLPEDIKNLARKNAITVRHEHWGADMYKLVEELKKIL